MLGFVIVVGARESNDGVMRFSAGPLQDATTLGTSIALLALGRRRRRVSKAPH